MERLDLTKVVDPNDVWLLLAGFPNALVTVVDEFDRVPQGNNARRLIADTIKLL